MTDNMPQKLDHIDRAPKYTPIEEIRELIEIKDLTYKQAGKILGLTKQAIGAACKRHGIERHALKKYKENRADIFASKGRLLLNSLTTDEIKKIPPGSRLTGFGILYDKERLERGQSTANVEVHVTQEERDNLKDIAKQAAQNHKMQASADGDGGDNL